MNGGGGWAGDVASCVRQPLLQVRLGTDLGMQGVPHDTRELRLSRRMLATRPRHSRALYSVSYIGGGA